MKFENTHITIEVNRKDENNDTANALIRIGEYGIQASYGAIFYILPFEIEGFIQIL